MFKTAILGGSFDPVHLGHLFLLHNAIEKTDYSRFIIIPAKVSNFKVDSRPVSTDSDRLQMLSLAIEDFHDLYPNDKKEILISDIEIKRGGVSYTYDTVIQIKKQYGITDRLGLIIGDDHISALKKWYRYEDLINEVEFIICPRNHSEDLNKIPAEIAYTLMEVQETKEENASAVRENVERYSQYLSKRVCDYAKDRKLYC